ncbi:hypothetical protein B0H63DRAFT_97890 [Podospora didyma]|uniref:Uncharacterized protein n=1 Tax=Podospora didyma TaxID=330526 RepID=A0AAE0NX85_9PEZI|nr:hypothetical protein B0H63DRAFT_97890 [Podospora didyma]
MDLYMYNCVNGSSVESLGIEFKCRTTWEQGGHKMIRGNGNAGRDGSHRADLRDILVCTAGDSADGCRSSSIRIAGPSRAPRPRNNIKKSSLALCSGLRPRLLDPSVSIWTRRVPAHRGCGSGERRSTDERLSREASFKARSGPTYPIGVVLIRSQWLVSLDFCEVDGLCEVANHGTKDPSLWLCGHLARPFREEKCRIIIKKEISSGK